MTYFCAEAKDAAHSPSEIRDRHLAAIPSEANEWCETEVVVTKGVASAQIVRIAEDEKADLVVIGAPRRWTSTTHAVLSRLQCPVLVTHDARPLPVPDSDRRPDRINTTV